MKIRNPGADKLLQQANRVSEDICRYLGARKEPPIAVFGALQATLFSSILDMLENSKEKDEAIIIARALKTNCNLFLDHLSKYEEFQDDKND